eukprot:scaffold13188_cov114-Skeletonema_dohrnii-CCMP3373.AAC.2
MDQGVMLALARLGFFVPLHHSETDAGKEKGRICPMSSFTLFLSFCTSFTTASLDTSCPVPYTRSSSFDEHSCATFAVAKS